MLQHFQFFSEGSLQPVHFESTELTTDHGVSTDSSEHLISSGVERAVQRSDEQITEKGNENQEEPPDM